MTDERLAEIDARLKARVEDESDWSGIADLLAEVRRLREALDVVRHGCCGIGLVEMASRVLGWPVPAAHPALASGATKGGKLGESCGNGGEN